jgi:hypothetical protein
MREAQPLPFLGSHGGQRGSWDYTASSHGRLDNPLDGAMEVMEPPFWRGTREVPFPFLGSHGGHGGSCDYTAPSHGRLDNPLDGVMEVMGPPFLRGINEAQPFPFLESYGGQRGSWDYMAPAHGRDKREARQSPLWSQGGHGVALSEWHEGSLTIPISCGSWDYMALSMGEERVIQYP